MQTELELKATTKVYLDEAGDDEWRDRLTTARTMAIGECSKVLGREMNFRLMSGGRIGKTIELYLNEAKHQTEYNMETGLKADEGFRHYAYATSYVRFDTRYYTEILGEVMKGPSGFA